LRLSIIIADKFKQKNDKETKTTLNILI